MIAVFKTVHKRHVKKKDKKTEAELSQDAETTDEQSGEADGDNKTVRDFRGAMEGRADKGIIITTGVFTVEAKKEARRDGAKPIELVNGDNLVELFQSLELGVTPRITYDVDEAFFDEYRE